MKQQERLSLGLNQVLTAFEHKAATEFQKLGNRLARLERQQRHTLPPDEEAAYERKQEHLTRLAEADHRRRE